MSENKNYLNEKFKMTQMNRTNATESKALTKQLPFKGFSKMKKDELQVRLKYFGNLPWFLYFRFNSP